MISKGQKKYLVVLFIKLLGPTTYKYLCPNSLVVFGKNNSHKFKEKNYSILNKQNYIVMGCVCLLGATHLKT